MKASVYSTIAVSVPKKEGCSHKCEKRGGGKTADLLLLVWIWLCPYQGPSVWTQHIAAGRGGGGGEEVRRQHTMTSSPSCGQSKQPGC